MNLVVDIGNTRAKAAIFDDGVMLRSWVAVNQQELPFDAVFDRYDIDRSILSSTRDDAEWVENLLADRTRHCIRFVNSVPVPLGNGYGTPETLGSDRLAAAVGAANLFPKRNILVVDFGSAMTVDIVTSDGVYLGGSISPGLGMRLRALAEFTGRLPLLSVDEEYCHSAGTVPSTTNDAILAGVTVGMELEVRGWIDVYSEKYPELVTIFTGGDAAFFEKRFKNTIFANRELVLAGLNAILDYNAD